MTISVEIESYSEVKSHPEHVLLNMKKWKEMGFSYLLWITKLLFQNNLILNVL